MSSIISISTLSTPLFGIFFSLVLYEIGSYLFKKTKGFFLLQPLFFAMVFGIIGLILLAKLYHMSPASFYTKTYKNGGDLVFWFLNPATIAFAIPLYKRNDVLFANWKLIISSLILGTVIALFAIVGVSMLFGLDKEGTASMLSQSATTAIALPISTSIGGVSSITAMACIWNAVIIYALGKYLIKWFKLGDKRIGAGLGLGTSGHTVGSAFALKLGSIEGAMAAVAVVVISVVDNIVIPPFAHLIGLI